MGTILENSRSTDNARRLAHLVRSCLNMSPPWSRINAGMAPVGARFEITGVDTEYQAEKLESSHIVCSCIHVAAYVAKITAEKPQKREEKLIKS